METSTSEEWKPERVRYGFPRYTRQSLPPTLHWPQSLSPRRLVKNRSTLPRRLKPPNIRQAREECRWKITHYYCCYLSRIIRPRRNFNFFSLHLSLFAENHKKTRPSAAKRKNRECLLSTLPTTTLSYQSASGFIPTPTTSFLHPFPSQYRTPCFNASK